MSQIEDFIESIDIDDNMDYLNKLIAEQDGLSLSQITEIQNYGKVKLSTYADIAESFEGATLEEAQYDLGLIWVELRSEWIRFNTVINYKIMMSGEHDHKTELLGSFSSYLLNKVEAYLTEERKKKVEQLIVDCQDFA